MTLSMINGDNGKNDTRHYRGFGKHDIYMPKNLTGKNNNKNGKDENKFKFKNSLIITPFYEIEFNNTGGIKYLRNHDNSVFLVGDNIYARTNGILKIPILIKREINKLSSQKKLIVEERYNFEEKYEIHQNIILYYEENRLDFQILFSKSKNLSGKNDKDITEEFSVNLFVPEISNIPETPDTVIYKTYKTQTCTSMFAANKNITPILPIVENPEWMIVKCEKEYMTILFDRNQYLKYKNKTLHFVVPNVNLKNQQKYYINFKLYLEKRESILTKK